MEIAVLTESVLGQRVSVFNIGHCAQARQRCILLGECVRVFIG